MNYKYDIKPKELFPTNVFPPQFAKLFEYIRYIPDDSEADFAYIERELLSAAQTCKVDPSLMIPLDWMNYRPMVSQPSSTLVLSPQPYKNSTNNRQTMNSQLSKKTVTSNANNVGLKTPNITEKGK